MSVYNIRKIILKNQVQFKTYKKPIDFDFKKVRSNEPKKKSDDERTQADIDLSIRQSINRTKDSIYKIALSNDWDYFCTFTFNPNIIQSNIYDECVYAMSNWLHNAKKKLAPDLKYLIVPEYHSDKSKFHFHALISNVGRLTLIDSQHRANKGTKIIYNCLNYRLGFSTFLPIDKNEESQNKICGYMLKYITKDLATLSIGRRRYWYSINNCEKPIINDFFVDIDEMNNYVECFENDKDFKKTINIPFTENECRIYTINL